MSVVEIALAALTVASFLLAVFSELRNRRDRERSDNAATVVGQRLDSATTSLEGAFAAVNAIVQLPKTRDVSVAELQDAARVARAQVLVSARILNKTDELIAHWRAGEVMAEVLQGQVGIRSPAPPPKEHDGQEPLAN